MRKFSKLKTKRKKSKRIYHNLINFFKWKILGTINKAYWWIKYHTTDKYHIVNISGMNNYEYGWIDRDEVLLLASFKILKDFVEKEDPKIGLRTVTDYFPKDYEFTYEGESEQINHQIEKENEIRAIYDWWIIERPKEQNDCELLLNECTGHSWYKRQEELDKKDEEMLIRLAKIRQCLWT